MKDSDITFLRLSREHSITTFDCGNDDLNAFLLNDAMDYQDNLIAVTYLVRIYDETIGYVSIANDKI